MKVGDLVISKVDDPSMGTGIILDTRETEDGILYFEVQWFDEMDVIWYDELELEVVSESKQ